MPCPFGRLWVDRRGGNAFLQDIIAHEVTENYLRYGGNSMDQALRIEGNCHAVDPLAVVEVRLAQDGFVDIGTKPAGEAVGILRVGHEAKCPVKEEQQDAYKEGAALLRVIDNNGRKEIGECN